MRAGSPLVVLLASWLTLGAACAPAVEAPPPEGSSGRLHAACVRALASLDPERGDAAYAPLELPGELELTLRALSGTGMGGRVEALDVELERAARLALRDLKEWLEEMASTLPDGGNPSPSAAFRAAHEAELRARLAPGAALALSGSHASEALAAVRDGAERLPLHRPVELDLVSAVTERAVERFFSALAQQEKSP